MNQESFLLLSNQSTSGSFTSAKLKGAGYYRKFDNLHTFTASFSNWSGLLKFQGTLKLYPNDDTDWFDLKDSLSNELIFGDDSTDYDQPITVNSTGNFVWIRAIGRNDTGSIDEIRYIY
jgi:hypothetical protein